MAMCERQSPSAGDTKARSIPGDACLAVTVELVKELAPGKERPRSRGCGRALVHLPRDVLHRDPPPRAPAFCTVGLFRVDPCQKVAVKELGPEHQVNFLAGGQHRAERIGNVLGKGPQPLCVVRRGRVARGFRVDLNLGRQIVTGALQGRADQGQGEIGLVVAAPVDVGGDKTEKLGV